MGSATPSSAGKKACRWNCWCTRPAEILGLAKGQLEPGYDADFVLVDLDTPYIVDKEKLHSKSHNCPFDGAQLYGRVYATIKGGKLTYQAEE